MIPSPRRILAPALLALALAGPAAGATLVLTGTPGAAVRLDGRDLGTLPLDAVTVAAGAHTLSASREGMLPLDVEVRIDDEEAVIRRHLRLLPMSRRDAVTYSLVLAGLGQRYEGRPLLGWVLTAAEAGGLLTALAGELALQNHRDDYDLAMANYREAMLPQDIAFYRAQAADAWAAADDAAGLRDTAAAVAVGAVVVSVLDAWLRFPSLDAGAGPAPAPPPGFAAAGGPSSVTGFHVGWSLRW
jgi:hypothetical protein